MLPSAGIIAFALGTMISLLNFYLGFVRYPLHQLRGKSREQFHWVSGMPLIGSMLLCMAAVGFSSASHRWMWASLLVALLDTGGFLWFSIVLLFHWDAMPWRLGKKR